MAGEFKFPAQRHEESSSSLENKAEGNFSNKAGVVKEDGGKGGGGGGVQITFHTQEKITPN